ncbi:histidine kinase [Lacihabitans sp. CCS-44]|uniref:sensor histidine kinase n=1 Tax=Lacihabitans sp. CCS-44 TaxID=2487331 RepID=UPI0020CF974C|nr:histidine kinase [Lacihabitans sp. CCS-44]MCP9757213.1 histidine kinase [Lacihabitans sp. CCS-44]
MDYAKNNKTWLSQYKVPLTHIFLWAVFFLLPLIFSISDYSQSEKKHLNPDEFFVLNIISKLFIIGFFYLNTQLLVPKFLYKKKYLVFLACQAMVFGLLLMLDFVLFELLNILHPFRFINSAYHNISLFIFTSLVSIVFKMVWDKAKTDEKQKENLKTELSFLRSQISPHFLFNVLNNIVAMVRLKHDALEDTVVKLSSLLQYMLYETDEEKVTIQSEMEYLKSYIELQSQRFGSKIKITTSFDIENSHLHIEPMLLIPFVENAFKHGYGMVESPAIDIMVKLENEILVVGIKNKYSKEDQQKDKTSGIGLANVKRRLELLYPKKHTLEIEPMDEWYTVNLNLNLNNQ